MGYLSRPARPASARELFPEILPPASDAKQVRPKATSAPTHALKDRGGDERNDRIRSTVLSVKTAHLYGELYADFLTARKHVFIDVKAWDLPQTDEMEFDQYDTPQSRSIVLHEYGKILAGIRILPTKARCGCYSYMLRDAQLGVINSIPPYVLYEEAPTADFIWEATRLFITADVPAARRLTVQTRLMLEMAKAVVDEGATHVIGIVPYVFRRWLDRIGMSALPIGPKLTMDGDTSQAAIMHVASFCDALPNSSSKR